MGLFKKLIKKNRPAEPKETANDEAIKETSTETAAEVFPSEDTSEAAKALFAIQQGGKGRRLEVGIEEVITPMVFEDEEETPELYNPIEEFSLDPESNTYMAKKSSSKETLAEDKSQFDWEKNQGLLDLNNLVDAKAEDIPDSDGDAGSDTDADYDEDDDDSEGSSYSDGDPDFD